MKLRWPDMANPSLTDVVLFLAVVIGAPCALGYVIWLLTV